MNTSMIRVMKPAAKPQKTALKAAETNLWSSGWREQAAYWIAERAYLLHTEGRFRESLTLFEGLASLDPGNLYTRDSISALHLALGNWAEAERYAGEVLAAEPGNVSALVRRCEARLRQGRAAAARAALDRLRAAGAGAPARRMELRLEQVSPPRVAAGRARQGKIEAEHATPRLARG